MQSAKALLPHWLAQLFSLQGLFVGLIAIVFKLSNAGLAILFLLLMNAAYVCWLYWLWKEAFSHRWPRSNSSSPSHKKFPMPSECPEVTFVREGGQARRRRSSAVKLFETAGGARRLSHSMAASLDMDHVYVSFRQFVWAWYWIAPNSTWLWVSGIVQLFVRERLHRVGWISPKPHEPEQVVAKLLLEGVGVLVHYNSQRKDTHGHELATFVWNDFPMLNKDGAFETAANLTIDVDLTRKRMVEAKLDSAQIAASDAMTLVWFNTISAAHVKVHALANWGVNLEANLDDYTRQCTLITVMYNYFGKSSFPRLADMWHSWGWTEKSWMRLCAPTSRSSSRGNHQKAADREPHRKGFTRDPPLTELEP